MSFGRSLYYIIGTKGWDGDVIEFMMPMGSISRDEFPFPHGREMSYAVPEEALQQFIAHLAARGTDVLQSWIDAGVELNEAYDATQEKRFRNGSKWLRTTVTVKRRGKKI